MKTTRRRIRIANCLISALGVAVVGATQAQDDRTIRFSTGFDYSSGDYGEATDTDILYIPLTARYELDRWTFRGTLPYLRIRSGGGVVGGGSNTVVVGEQTDTGRTTESGIGDVTASASYFVFFGTETLPMVDITGRVKVPTADEDKGLGTGKIDFAIETDLTKVYGEYVGFGTVGYKKFGDPDDFDLNDVLYASIGAQQKFDALTSGGLIYDVREATSDTNSSTSELTAYVSRKTKGRLRYLGYGVIGFADGSPDWGIGLTVSTDARVDELTVENLKRVLPFWKRNKE